MIDIDNVAASQRVLAHLDEGRLEQQAWHLKRDGRELACILGSMHPDIDSAEKCPAAVMPLWLARLTVRLFDRQRPADAMAWARRYAEQMSRWHTLNDAAWGRVDIAFRILCVQSAVQSAEPVSSKLAVWPRVKAACEGVVAALRAGTGLAEARTAAAAAAHAAYAAAAGHAAYAAAYAAADAADAAADADAAAADAYADAAAAALAKGLCDCIDAELAAAQGATQ